MNDFNAWLARQFCNVSTQSKLFQNPRISEGRRVYRGLPEERGASGRAERWLCQEHRGQEQEEEQHAD